MEAQWLVLWVVVGGAIGWLASQIMEKGRLGGLNDVLAGVAGAALFGWLLPELGFVLGGKISQTQFAAPVLAHLVNAALGAVIGTFAGRFYIQYQEKSSSTSGKGR